MRSEEASNGGSCSAYLSGGSITLRSGTVLDLTNCVITGNQAFYGGGILNLGGARSLEGTTVSTNIATGGGGISTGILSANGSLTNDSSIVGNTGGGGGGGIAIGSGGDRFISFR